MTPERAHDVELLCQEPGARATFLAQACASDDALRLEVESLPSQESGAAGW